MIVREIEVRFGPASKEWDGRKPFRNSGEVARWFGGLEDETREKFVCVHLDSKNRPLRYEVVSVGSLTSSLVHPREVFRAAIRELAVSVLFIHNHPSGQVEPSQEDVALTRRLVEVGELLGIKVLDHIVIGTNGRYASLKEMGLVIL